MKDENPKMYSNSKYNKVMKNLRNQNLERDERINSLKIVDHFRGSHEYPLNVFKKRLIRICEKDKIEGLISSRLKRTSSIIKKSLRTSMDLTKMQDIAGCRIILNNIEDIYNFKKKYYNGRNIKHKLKKENNYISSPKNDGYRSYHLIYEYKTDKNKTQYNGLLVEIQLRTKLQHSWATTVEIVDFFTNQKLKLNNGNKNWVEFFKTVSLSFQLKEEKKEINSKIIEKILKIENKLKVFEKLEHWFNSFSILDLNYSNKKNIKFISLEMDFVKKDVIIKTFSKNENKKALKYYLDKEKNIFDNENYDIVLVSVDSIKNIKKSYPNYFLDSTQFVKELKRIIKSKK